MTAPYDHQALWTKAKLFLNRAMDLDGTRSFDEQALWASASLELLGKSALARVSPLLIAEPNEEGINILIATGLVEGEARFGSIRASTVFKRCQRAFHPFSAKEAEAFSGARNEYLHGAGVGFLAIPEHAWWPRFWSLVTTLVTAQDRDIAELVGEDRVEVVEGFLAQNAKNVEHRTEALIERARQRLAQHHAGTLPAKIQAEWQSKPDLTLGLNWSTEAGCPACGTSGTLEGQDYTNIEYEYVPWGDEEFEGVDVIATLTIAADYFSCSNCHLVLDGYELIAQADLATSFQVVDESGDYTEPEYGND
jgi:hypothetical protein